MIRSSRDGDPSGAVVQRRTDAPRDATQTSKPPQGWWQVLKTTFSDFQEDKATRLAAALAYYTIFSIAPLLLIVLAVAGFVFGEEAVSARMDEEMRGFVGESGAQVLQDMVAHARKPGAGILASTIGVVLLIFGATGVFAQLKDALNTIWEVEPAPGRGWWRTIRDRVLSFAMVLCIGFILLVSLVVSAALAAAQEWMGNLIPGPDAVVHVLNYVASLLVIALLFALIFKYLPDAQVAWRHVWLGALATAALFTLGKLAFGLYLGQGTIGSTYGAAGSVIVVLLWAYYSAVILFLGAEFTQAHARSSGAAIQPAEDAVAVTQEARAQQGLKSNGGQTRSPTEPQRQTEPQHRPTSTHSR